MSLRTLFPLVCLMLASPLHAENITLKLRSISGSDSGKPLAHQTQEQTWDLKETAIIVCDTWDYHHCLNAVKRLEEFGPRLNQVLESARTRGTTIIHAPSDCMPAYAEHPARKRATAAMVSKASKALPPDIAHWCSRIPAEAKADYPIDQSDGGEDDDPAEHATWAAKLTAMGRNPGMPWKKQADMIKIHEDVDFISDRGDEVWTILQQQGIKHVILTGVHTNMCVLGRPFGLRQMVRNGMSVVLMRDMTDCMYNPKRFPYVDHFTGNDLVISYVERYICPTITSDQFLGGQPFRSQSDKREKIDIITVPANKSTQRSAFEKHWNRVTIPINDWKEATSGVLSEYSGVAWYRCAVRTPKMFVPNAGLILQLGKHPLPVQAWVNGKGLALQQPIDGKIAFEISSTMLELDDSNLLVLRVEHNRSKVLDFEPTISGNGSNINLAGRWQFRLGNNASWSNIPLPAKFGAAPDMYFEP